MRSILRGALLFGVIAVLCAGLAISVDRGVTAKKGELGRDRGASMIGVGATQGHEVRVKNITRDDVMNFLNTSRDGYDPNRAANAKVQSLVMDAEYQFKLGNKEAARQELARANRLGASPELLSAASGIERPRFNARRSSTLGTNDALGSNCGNATLVALPYSDLQSLPVAGTSNWRSFAIAGPDAEVIDIVCVSAGPDPFEDDCNLTLYGGCSAGTPTDELVFVEDTFDPYGFGANIQECLPPGDYFVRVGGFLDATTWADANFSIESLGTCFIPVADEFEYDDESSYAVVAECQLVGGVTCDDADHHHHNGWWWWGDGDSEDDDPCVPVEPECILATSQCRTIFPAGDIDNVKFNVGSEARRVVIETGPSADCGNGPGDNPDTLMGIATPFGTLFAVNDDKAPGNFGSRLEFCAEPDAEYIVVILAFDASAEFAYNVSITSDEPCTLGAEPNGLCEDADVVPVTGWSTGSPTYTYSGFYNSGGLSDLYADLAWGDFIVLPFGELDFYTFTLTESCLFTIESSASDVVRTDSFLALYSGCPIAFPDNWIAQDDDAGNGGLGLTSKITAFLDPGQYWVWIAESPFYISPGDYFPYDLTFTCEEPPPPPQFFTVSEVEPNNTVATANAVPFGATQFSVTTIDNASLDTVSDFNDCYSFSVAANTSVNFGSVFNSGSSDSIYGLFTGAGVAICCDDDGGAGFMSNIAACLTPGTYVLCVNEYSTPSAMGYDTVITNNGTCGAASCVADNSSLSCPYVF